MKSILIAVAAGLALSMAGLASAAEGEDLAKAGGCLTCHDMGDKAKVGKPFAKVRADAPAKGKARDEYEAKLVDKVANGKGHMKPKASKEEVAKIIHAVVDK